MRRRGGFAHPELRQGGQVDDLIAYGYSAAKFLRGIASTEYGEGQILDRKFAADPIGRIQPAACVRIVRFIQ